MVAPNEFWLALHNLAVAYDAEGLTPAERAKSIVGQFRVMPYLAQREVMSDLLRVTVNCPDLYPLIVAEAKASEAKAGVRLAAG